MTVLFKSEKDCGAALFCTCRSKEERFEKLSPSLSIHSHRKIGEGPKISPCCFKEEGIAESWLQPWLFIALLLLRRTGEGFQSVPAVLKRKGLESWLQPWLFIALLFSRRIGEGFRSVPAVLKRKGLESWLQPWR
jgi:hypothetical protein